REGTSYYLEQALIAMLVAGRDCAVAPAADYVTLPQPPEALECRAVMHHYVAESKRWYFQRNWRQALLAP
ncbi:MAG: glycosyl transferase family 2, partial [Lacunisphaera sp.]|nr:glycosyl transferase family 2 [Lacunisphaera sp.]